jgi:hypothetical protein
MKTTVMLIHDVKRSSREAVAMTAEGLQIERIRVLYEQLFFVLVGNIFISTILTAFLYKYTGNIVSIYCETNRVRSFQKTNRVRSFHATFIC